MFIHSSANGGSYEGPFFGYFRLSVHPVWAYESFLRETLGTQAKWVFDSWALQCTIQLLRFYLELVQAPIFQTNLSRQERLMTRMHVGWILLCMAKDDFDANLANQVKNLAFDYLEFLSRQNADVYSTLEYVIKFCGF